jgi:hypothetical protein
MSNLPPAPLPPLRPRQNGWTVARQKAFLDALTETASVVEAARRVNMTPQSAYWLRRHPAAAEFRAAWSAAIDDAWQKVEDSALDRVINGETEIFERDGVRIVRHKPCAPSLVARMLERAVTAREKAQSLEKAERERQWRATIAQVRADIRALPQKADADENR